MAIKNACDMKVVDAEIEVHKEQFRNLIELKVQTQLDTEVYN